MEVFFHWTTQFDFTAQVTVSMETMSSSMIVKLRHCLRLSPLFGQLSSKTYKQGSWRSTFENLTVPQSALKHRCPGNTPQVPGNTLRSNTRQMSKQHTKQ